MRVIKNHEKEKCLKELNLPMATMIINKGKIYYNDMFKMCFNIVNNESVDEIIKKLDLKSSRNIIETTNNTYDVYISKKTNDVITAVFIDATRNIELKDINKNMIGYVIIDNYEETIAKLEMSKKGIVEALVDRKINEMANKPSYIIEKIEVDRYLIILRYEEYLKLKSDNFSILESIKKIKINDDMQITISIGFGMSKTNLYSNKEYAKTALELALGRGGDQVVLKNGDKYEIFGGETEETVSRSAVRGRVKAQILKKLMVRADKIIVMGHKNPDLDSLGASIGVNKLAVALGKQCNIIIGEVTSSIKLLHDRLVEDDKFDNDVFITGEKALKEITKNTLLIIVDVNKGVLVEYPKLLEASEKTVLIDHHRKDIESIKDTILSYHVSSASSTSELVIDLIKYYKENIKLEKVEADALLAGMVVDTKNFSFKTSSKTFENASYVNVAGAETSRVQNLLQSGIKEYKIKTDIVNTAVLYGDIAISTYVGEMENPKLLIAQAADELLNLAEINVSFVLTKTSKGVLVSARSLGKTNVQKILENLGGGGHRTMAAGIVLDKTLEEVKQMILSYLKIMEG